MSQAPDTKTPKAEATDYDLVDIAPEVHEAVRDFCGDTPEERTDEDIFYQAAKRIKTGANGALILNLLEPIAIPGDPDCDRITFRKVLGKDYVSGAADANPWVLGDALGDGRVSLLTCEEDMAGVAVCVKAQRGNFASRRKSPKT